VPGYECATWVGLVGPANMSASVVARLNAMIAGALATPEVRDPLAKGGLEPESSTPERLAAQIRVDLAKWEPVLKTLGLKRE
jgi:tripartite-type tricarboxylate transporter receptor subunit TctC